MPPEAASFNPLSDSTGSDSALGALLSFNFCRCLRAGLGRLFARSGARKAGSARGIGRSRRKPDAHDATVRRRPQSSGASYDISSLRGARGNDGAGTSRRKRVGDRARTHATGVRFTCSGQIGQWRDALKPETLERAMACTDFWISIQPKDSILSLSSGDYATKCIAAWLLLIDTGRDFVCCHHARPFHPKFHVTRLHALYRLTNVPVRHIEPRNKLAPTLLVSAAGAGIDPP
jgi:hypothetical protein